MQAIDKLQKLYSMRDEINEHIQKVETLLGADPAEVKVKRKRGPNKPKLAVVPQTQM